LLDAALQQLYVRRDFKGCGRPFALIFGQGLSSFYDGRIFMTNDTDDEKPPSLDEFSDRLGRMRGDQEPEKSHSSGAAWGRAMRVSTELLAGLFVGCLIGVGLDRWLGTAPWFLLAGMGLGFAAGLRNLTRSLNNGGEGSSDH